MTYHPSAYHIIVNIIKLIEDFNEWEAENHNLGTEARLKALKDLVTKIHIASIGL